MPKISVIVPVYKVEKYLNKCVDSILAQTFTDFELILVDDGSPDNCPKICDEYAEKDERVKVIHKENGGLSDARNKGLDIATGEYISFIDSDDWVENTFLQVLYESIVEYDVEISMVNYVFIYPDRTVDFKVKSMGYLKEAEKNKILHRIGGYVNATNKLFKSEHFDGIRFPYGKLYEDAYTIYKVIYKAKAMYVENAVLYNYRQRDDSIMRQVVEDKQIRDNYDFYIERAEFFKSNNLKETFIGNERRRLFTIKELIFKIYDCKCDKKLRKKWEKIFKADIRKNYKYMTASDDAFSRKAMNIVLSISPKCYYVIYKFIHKK